MSFILFSVQVLPGFCPQDLHFPPFNFLCYSERCTFCVCAFLVFIKTLQWTQELLKRRYADLTLSKLSTPKLVRELTNHLSLLVKELKVELLGSAELTSKTKNLCANYTNTQVETCTSTTSVTVHKWSIHTSKDNLLNRLSFQESPGCAWAFLLFLLLQVWLRYETECPARLDNTSKYQKPWRLYQKVM